MNRILFSALVIGSFMTASPDLQARHRRKVLPRPVRAGIAVAALSHAPLVIYHGIQVRQGRIAREIRSNEKRIWTLERRINRLDHYRGNFREIRALEREIDQLQRRNHFLRCRLY